MIRVRDAVGGSGAQDNLVATTNPGVSNDSTQGYSVKSWWLNTISMEFFVCLDASPGAANWQNTTLTIDQLGSMAVQAASNVNISGGAISGITDLAVADGGTGAGTAAGARTNLDVPSTTEAQALAAKYAIVLG